MSRQGELTPAMGRKNVRDEGGWTIQIPPAEGAETAPATDMSPDEPSPRASAEERCCSCLRYADTITVSVLLSAEIGLLDPHTKVETARYPACLVTPTAGVPPRTPRSPDPNGNSFLFRDGARPSPSFAAADFLLTTDLQPTHLHKRTSSDFPQPSRHNSHSDMHILVDSTPPVACGAYLAPEWVAEPGRPMALTIETLLQKHHQDAMETPNTISPPGLTVFAKSAAHDVCVCACHAVTTSFILEEFLHQGFTSTVIACRRVAALSQEVIDKYFPKSRVRGYISPSSEDDNSSSNSDNSKPSQTSVKRALEWLMPIQTAHELVIKLVHKNRCSAEELERCMQETRFLSMLDHPNVARLLAHFDGTNELWMFFERACYSDLEESLRGRSLTEAQVQPIVRQILLALEHVHSRNVIHCDVKPKNILVYDADRVRFRQPRRYGASRKFEGNWSLTELKLGDLGLARLVTDPSGKVRFDGVRGSHGYFAPEILLRRDYDCKVDVWAVGIIAYTLLAGYEPFYPPSACISEEIKFDSRYWSSISSTAQDFCRRLLAFDPARRLSAGEALQHPWMHEAERSHNYDRPLRVLPGSKSSANLCLRNCDA